MLRWNGIDTMCSIFGAYGPRINTAILSSIREQAKDRGRDGGRVEHYDFPNGMKGVLGNWRATPTPEHAEGALQPYEGIVHNGTIANDEQLGGDPSEIDSQVLARVLDRTSYGDFVQSLRVLKGSYALGVKAEHTIYLACNYKPIHYWSPDGETVYFSSMERHFDYVIPVGQRPVHLEPYSAIDLSNMMHTCRVPRVAERKALVIASGGLDSTVVAAYLRANGYEVTLLHFLYGCRAQTREARLIPRIAEALKCDYVMAPLAYGKMKGNSPLLTGGEIAGAVEGAEFAHEWVPARNLLMLAYATAYADANGYDTIALGNNLEESGAYPDNEEQLTVMFNALLPYTVRADSHVQVVAPVGNLMKHEIVALGVSLDAPLDLTWSCYRGGDKHCGECGPCFMRKTAYDRNGLKDPVF